MEMWQTELCTRDMARRSLIDSSRQPIKMQNIVQCLKKKSIANLHYKNLQNSENAEGELYHSEWTLYLNTQTKEQLHGERKAKS